MTNRFRNPMTLATSVSLKKNMTDGGPEDTPIVATSLQPETYPRCHPMAVDEDDIRIARV